MKTCRVLIIFTVLFAVACAFTGCPNITGSGGKEGPTHSVTEKACIYLYRGDQWGKNPKLSNCVANQCANGPLWGEGDGDAKVAVLEKGTEVQDRGAMPVTVNTSSGVRQTTVRYVVVMSGPQKDAKGWIADDYLTSTGE